MYHLIGMMTESEVKEDTSLSELTDVHMFEIINDFFGGMLSVAYLHIHIALKIKHCHF